jgi:hypothetical protein
MILRMVLFFAESNQEREDGLTRRQAQKDKPAATNVKKMKNGSLTKRAPSANARHICARVTRAKTTPVVMTYAFIGFAKITVVFATSEVIWDGRSCD